MHNSLKLFFPVCTAILAALTAFSPLPAKAEGVLAPPAVLVELFTSQGCYSCPPAEKVLAESIAPHPDIAALEFHVDYWDDLVYGGSVWADPFSDNLHTRRQSSYNVKIRRTGSVYTPQTVIHGHRQASGTQESRILSAVGESLKKSPPVRFRFLNSRTVRAEGSLPPGARVSYAIFWKERITEISAGENKGKTLKNTNVVSEFQQLPFGVRDLVLPELAPDQGCAVWLQQGSAGRVLSAAKCPI